MEARNQPTTSLSNVIGDGFDTLWRFQLRKENAVLLENLEENARAIEVCRSENMKSFQNFDERIARIEATISNIQKTEEEVVEAWESGKREVINLRDKLENHIQNGTSQTNADSCQNNDERISVPPPSLTELPVHSSTPECTRAQIQSPRPAHSRHITMSSKILSKSSSNLASSSSKTKCSTPVRANAIKCKPAIRITDSCKPPNFDGNAKKMAPATRHTPSQTSTIYRGEILDLPHLVQSSVSSLRAYHISASIELAKLTLDKSEEIKFVAKFVKGIQNDSKRSLLIKQLEKTNPSFTESGEQQILCEWSDVAEALISSGLVEQEEAVGAPPARKKRRVLIPPEMIKDGMMRQSS